ncbi:hypothetical protein EF908_00375 [Streptomyces sp. WAC04770]|nr:hypothetical protein [Streptomyces sp. WAC04770]RST25316.1 hypothetical protein EF908_00375 [Streptomyces sp. WAC04770]
MLGARGTGRVGVRELTYEVRKQATTFKIDPADFSCPALAAQLADAWIDYHHKAALKQSHVYRTAVRSFLKFTGPHLSKLGLDPGDARLDGDRIDISEVIYAWENHLTARYDESSTRPWGLVSSVLTLIHHRAERDPKVPDKLRRRAAAAPGFRKATSQSLDEFSNAERLAIKGAAQADLRALEKRLSWGRELLAMGRDPREHGWMVLPNLVWAARQRILTTAIMREHYPRSSRGWPPELEEVRVLGRQVGISGLLRGVYGLLFPQELDLHPFRVLLSLSMLDCAIEELHVLQIPDLEFGNHGVRIVQTKNRADRIRADYHLADSAVEEDEGPGDLVYEGRGDWDVPGLLRRLIKVNTLTREVFTCKPFLFTAVENRGKTKVMSAGFARFHAPGRRPHPLDRLPHGHRRHTNAGHFSAP